MGRSISVALVLVTGLLTGVGCGSTPPVRELPIDDPPTDPWVVALRTESATNAWSPTRCREVTRLYRRAHLRRDDVEALLRAAEIEQRCGQRSRARFLVELARRDRPRDCRVTVRLARLSEPAEARRLLDAALGREPNCFSALFLAGRMLREDEPRRAVELLQHALSRQPTRVDVHNELALAWLASEDASGRERAALVCEQGARLDPDFAPIQNTWGLVDLQRGRVVEALARFEHAFVLDPELFEAWMNFAQVTLSFRGYADAELAYRHALEVRPQNYDALVGRGVALRALGRLDEARRHYELAHAINPERPDAWFNLGLLFQEHLDGDSEQRLRLAQQYFQRFLETADERYVDEVNEVSRECVARDVRCVPGRLQRIGAVLAR